MIKTVTKYQFKGQEFSTLKEVQDFVHNIIGEEVLDKINKTCDIRHKDWLKMLEILCSKDVRETLLECYNVTYDHSNEYDDSEDEKLNILDLK